MTRFENLLKQAIEKKETIEITSRIENEMMSFYGFLEDMAFEERSTYLIEELKNMIGSSLLSTFLKHPLYDYIDEVDDFIGKNTDNIYLIPNFSSFLDKIKNLVDREKKRMNKGAESLEQDTEDSERFEADVIYLIRSEYPSLYASIVDEINNNHIKS